MPAHQLPLGNIQGLKKQINIYKKEGRDSPHFNTGTYFPPFVCSPPHYFIRQQKTKGSSPPWCWDADSTDDLSHAIPHFIMHEEEKQIFRLISLDQWFLTRGDFSTKGTFGNVSRHF